MNRFATASFATLLSSTALLAQNPMPNANSATVSRGGFSTAQTVIVDGKAAPKADSAQKEAPAVVLRMTLAGVGCPVSMRAQQRVWGDMMAVDRVPGDRPAATGVAQRIHLTLAGAADSASIREAKVTVHGTGNKGRSVPSQLTQDGLPDKTRTLDVVFSGYDKAAASTDLLLRGFTSVSWITLESVTYSDGSTWTPSGGKSCRTVPDPLMLVAAH
jgi:hypothetical protein